MPTFKLTIAYDGTKFSGWQFQPKCRTVQGAVQTAWEQITGEAVQVSATSRTDAGVHALGQVVGVNSATHLAADQLYRALNAKLPEDVVLVAIEEVAAGFHATRDAVGKRYRYRIHNERTRPLFDRNFVWHVPQSLDVDMMQRAGQALVGTHDFVSFQAAGSERESTVRTITVVQVRRCLRELSSSVLIDVEGDGFLYNMVRIIVGSLVEVGVGRREEQWLAEALAARDRRAAGKTAPPQGLCLFHVYY
ncbi:MAG: tRNA pseudouridine(38-40) synthase TruA [Bythopirellula sp.]|nr:tRNA pseudouridine(38-40) synthase TruA [Bythopirellula sp.]